MNIKKGASNAGFGFFIGIKKLQPKMPKKMKIIYPLIATLFFSPVAHSEKLDIKLRNSTPDVELKGEYIFKTFSEAITAAEREYEKVAKQGLATDEGMRGVGFVMLPFDVSDFSKKSEILFLLEVRNVHNSKVITKSWVNPRNGKCIFFDGPWLLTPLDQLDSISGANEPNDSGAGAGLGKPAKFEVSENGKEVSYSAELVQLQRFGQYSWIKEKLPSPRTVYQFRTTRQRDGQEIEQIGPAFLSETALQPDVEPPECKDVPWTPSIIVDNGVVWVLFTRYVYDHLGVPFKLYRFNADAAGRSPDKEDVIGKETKHKAPDFSGNVSPDMTVKLEDSREEECFYAYRGAFRIKKIENGELVLSAPVLLKEFSPKVNESFNLFYGSEYNAAKARHELNPDDSPAPVHYRELMKDKELLLRYHIEKNRWKLDIPEGYRRRGTL